MAISAKEVMELRKKTGLGMMECKKALTETDGDMQAAIEQLRKQGLAKMDTRTDRESAEGRVAAFVTDDRSRGALIEVNTETDFTANNESFRQMVDELAQMALEQGPGEVTKTDAMQEKIDDVRLTTKENVQFNRGHVLGSDGANVGSYVHFTGKIGVVVEVEGDVDDELLKDLCMHVSGISPVPLGVTEDEVPGDVVNREREIAKAQALDTGKPENIVEKIVEGKVRKFYEEHVLLLQPFIKDDKKQVKDILPKGATIKRFVRYQVGG